MKPVRCTKTSATKVFRNDMPGLIEMRPDEMLNKQGKNEPSVCCNLFLPSALDINSVTG